MTRRLLFALLLLAVPGPAAAQTIIADLSAREVAITTGFTGQDLLLFGTTEGAGDLIVTVIGPRGDEVVRRKERIAGIWVNGASMTFERAPAYYRVAATRPLEEIAGEKMLERLRIGPSNLHLFTEEAHPAPEVRAFREALIRNKQRLGLYGIDTSEITIHRRRLFRTDIPFPSNVPTGEYLVTVYLFRDGQLLNRETTPLTVHRVGLEAQIFEFAYEQAPLYGAIAIAIALVAGWLAGVIFRRT